MATLSFGSHSVITGGTFTQVNNNNNLQERAQTPWDRLQAAVAPAAFHNSAEHFDSPRCHPNTRVAVMNELRDLAFRRGEVGKARVLWLSGPAGAGKSAIVQSFCEECFSTHFLLASFFFNRSDATRNNAKSFVATLAYQIYGRVPTYHQSLILSVIENDPLVFGRSIDAQFKALIMDPLRDLFTAGYFDNSTTAPLVVIDGLDECSRAPVQVSILNALKNISMQSDSPFVFVVASRPEHDIQMFFRSSSLGRLFHQLNLDDSYCPVVDIELFLREKIQEMCATHPLKDSILRQWPSDEAIQAIVQKSSGQFVYASVVVKYVTSSRHYPPNRLDVVRQLRPPKRDLPFAELDAFYSHIFSCVEDIALVLCILRIVLLFQDEHIDISTKDVEQLCGLDQGECLSALCDLWSVLHVEPTIRLLHKSLPNYLQDPARSHDYHIDTTSEAVIHVASQCLRYISDLKLEYNIQYSDFILNHLGLLVGNIQLCHEHLMSFSLINCWQIFHGTKVEVGEYSRITRYNLARFTFAFLDNLCTLKGTDCKHIYYHHLRQFGTLVDQYPEIYGPSSSFEHDSCIFPMIVVSVLLGDSDTHVPPEVFKFLQLLPFEKLSQALLAQSPKGWMQTLISCAARRCISFLMCDSRPKTGAFALEFLSLALPSAALLPDLNEACLLGRPFAYAASGDHGLSELAYSTYTAMRKYRERYAEAQLAVKG